MPRPYLTSILCGLAAAACGGSESRPATPVVDEPTERTRRVPDADDEGPEDGLELESSKGHLEPHQIEAALRPHQAALGACYHDQAKQARFLDGSVELGFVVDPDGAVKDVRVVKGDLGSWTVEKCMLDVSRAIAFAKPRGKADADFSIPLDFKSGKGNVIWWAEERAEAEVDKYVLELDACSGEAEAAPSNVWVTLYVGPRGQVKSVGFASPSSAIGDDWATCVTEKSAAWALSDPRGKIAKAGFRYRPE